MIVSFPTPQNVHETRRLHGMAFRIIKNSLSSKPVLAVYNPRAECTELHTDSLADGLGAMLLQADEKHEFRLVDATRKEILSLEIPILWIDKLRIKVESYNIKHLYSLNSKSYYTMSKNI